jgi:hypothetical protein
MTNNKRRLGIAMILGATGLLAFAYLMAGYVGWFAWVLAAIAIFNFGQGIFWLLKRGS